MRGREELLDVMREETAKKGKTPAMLVRVSFKVKVCCFVTASARVVCVWV